MHMIQDVRCIVQFLPATKRQPTCTISSQMVNKIVNRENCTCIPIQSCYDM